MIFKKLTLGSYFVNCYILGDERSKQALIIDPGAEYDKINSFLKENKLRPVAVINTHGHLDHIQEDDRFNLPIYIHSQDKNCFAEPKENLSAYFGMPFTVRSKPILLEDNQRLSLAGFDIEVIHTPGHTKGCICLKIADMLFSGDTLFASSIGRTDFPGADSKAIIDSIKKRLFTIKEDLRVFPGHGADTTLEREKRTNCFLN